MPVIATAGHVDHGKSSLIHALTGTDPDRLEEEKRKGMTIDLGFAHVVTPDGNTLSFVDVPGHSDFIRTMISGVSGVDVALLVIDAGEGWKPQTEEHLGILEVLGIRRGVVALSKCDKFDDAHLQRRQQELSERLSHSPITWSDIVATSAHAGHGLDRLVNILSSLSKNSSRTIRPKSPRLFVDRVFTMKGSGTVVTGTLDTAPIHNGDVLMITRTQNDVRIREIQVHGKKVDICEPGTRCAINIAGLHTTDIVRGDALIAPNGWLATTVCDASLSVLSGVLRPITHRGSFTFHVGSDFQSATVRVLQAAEIFPGENRNIRLRFARSLPLVPGDRFLLRDTSTNTTVGGGTILDIAPHVRISAAQPDGSLESILNGRGFIDVDTARLLTGIDVQPVIGQWFAPPEVFQLTQTALQQKLETESELHLVQLAEYERNIVEQMPNVFIENGIARRSASDSIDNHPIAQRIKEWGLTGSSSSELERNTVRQLVQRGVVYEHDSIAFHRDTLESLRPHLESLWVLSPGGFTVAELRNALSITRKHAVPLAECLDKYGLTRRSGDLRLRGHRW
jgi:selenocysteine-specific elongation factor